MKYFKKILYLAYLLLKQKYIKLKNGKKLKYVLIRNKKSNELIVSFSGFPGEGKKAKYNYTKALKRVKKNKLFILDDFGYQSAGSYYLGENRRLFFRNSNKKSC